jgi:hypothetical protein
VNRIVFLCFKIEYKSCVIEQHAIIGKVLSVFPSFSKSQTTISRTTPFRALSRVVEILDISRGKILLSNSG